MSEEQNRMKQNCHHYETCHKPVPLCTSKCAEYVERVCGNCAFFTGEECNGAYEGAERYDDSEACASFEPNAKISGGIPYAESDC